ELHPSAMAGALERIARVKRVRRRLLEVLADDRRLEERDVVDLQERRLPERRLRQEPGRLLGEVDVDALEGEALLHEGDGDALDVGAEVVAHERQLRHGILRSGLARLREQRGGPEPVRDDSVEGEEATTADDERERE